MKTDEFTDRFFKWMDSHHLKPRDVASHLDNNWQTVSSWRSKGIPKGKQFSCKALMEQHRTKMAEPTVQTILRPTYDQFTRWNIAALECRKTIEDWAIDGLNEMADEAFPDEEPSKPSQPWPIAAEDPSSYNHGKSPPDQ